MSSSLKSLSQIWGKNAEAGAETVTSQSFNNAESDTTKPNSSSRRRLSKQFSSSSDSKHHPMLLRSRNVLTSISNLNVGSVPKETRKFFQAGAEKVTTTLNGVRSTIGNWSQKLNPSRRHQRLVNSSPYTPGKGGKRGTPRTKALLGRSPTKLYSPFGIETPSNRRQRNHQNLYGQPGTYTPTRNNKKLPSGSAFDPCYMYSPTQNFPKDVQHVREGVAEFTRAAEGVVRRSLRQQLPTAQV